MPDLLHTLQGHDLGFLKMVANTWGIEFNAPDVRTGLATLVHSMLDAHLANEVVDTLPESAHQVLLKLADGDGRMLWAAFTRQFGDVRSMGPAKRDRERPDLRPASPAELLWYRGLVGRAFLSTDNEPQEFAYIPEDLLELLHPIQTNIPAAPGRPATVNECIHVFPATDRILDHAATLLAALRSGIPMENIQTDQWLFSPALLEELLINAHLVDANHLPVPDAAREFLALPRAKALLKLFSIWQDSSQFNELRQLPGLHCEGEWFNDPRKARQKILEWVSLLMVNTWWSLPAFIAAIKEKNPDYQRPAGDYDSWFLVQDATGKYLRGFTAWDEVDGALVRYLITGPLHWLGFTDLASAAVDEPISAFRLTDWVGAFLSNQPPQGFPEENGKIKAFSDASLFVPRLTPRAVRYQVARFCHWGKETSEGYEYQITPDSLERAIRQGLKTNQLLGLLTKHATSPTPPAMIQAVERWERVGIQIRMENFTVLQITNPEILNTLKGTKAARYLGEMLGPNAVVVKPGGMETVRKALAEAGYLAACIEKGTYPPPEA